MENKIFVNARFLTQKVTGVQRFAVDLSLKLKELKSNVTFVSPKGVTNRHIEKILTPEYIDASFSNGIIWEQQALVRALNKKMKPLLLNLCNTAPLMYSNNIVTIHDIAYKIHPEWFDQKFVMYYKFLMPKIIKKSVQLITVSQSSRIDIHEHYNVPLDSIKIIHPSVSGIFSQGLFAEPATEKTFEYILAVSSLDPRKNFKGLVEAFVDCNFKDIKLVIVGSENTLFADDNLREITNKNKNIIFTGYIEDDKLVRLYKNALFFAYPSYFEGFGLPPLEAMSCGCPTLVSRTTSMPEVCGEASYYVNPYDKYNLREGLVKMKSDSSLRQNLVNRGFEQIKKFSLNKSTQDLLSLVNMLTE